MTKIKICGITNLQDAFYACDLGADALGFIFTKSPRRISPQNAERIIKKLPPYVSTVGVFVDENAEDVMKIAFSCHLTAVQFHGRQTQKELYAFAPLKAIKAFRVKDAESLKPLPHFPDVDAFLLDAHTKGKTGGTGKTFNWNLAAAARKKVDKPLILAGGLTPQNVADAIRKVKPYAVDVASGVEKSPGVKDYKKLKKFIENARKAGR